MKIYFLKNYNSYFNRRIKLLTCVQDYLDEVGVNNYFLIDEVNFSEGDGIHSTQVLGSNNNPFTYSWIPDYALVVENNVIISRWFVLSFAKLRKNQYNTEFRRDVIADYYNQVMDAPCFIEKGFVNENNPLIVNSEGMSFNQIKVNEYFIKDISKTAWLVGYINQKRGHWSDENPPVWVDEDWVIESDYIPESPETLPVIEDDPVMSELFFNGGVFSPTAVRKKIVAVAYNMNVDAEMGSDKTVVTFYDSTGSTGYVNASTIAGLNNLFTCVNNIPKGDAEMVAADFRDDDRGDEFLAEEFDDYNYMVYQDYPTVQKNKMWYSRTQNKNYTLKFETVGASTSRTTIGNAYSNHLWNVINDGRTATLIKLSHNPPQFKVNITGTQRNYQLVENATTKSKIEIKHNENHCLDVPYDIICMPLGDIDVYNNTTKLFNCDGLSSLNLMRQLVVDKSANIYDIQVLPFCPINTGIIQDHKIDVSKGGEHLDFEYLVDKNDTTKKISVMLFASYSSLTFDTNKLYKTLNDYTGVNISDIISIQNRKLQNECESFRIVSPNYQGIFEFNPAKCIPLNKTSINKFNVDVTFRPYSPYVHINPEFGFLYGKDYDDSRGLICGGNFSITTTSDAWKTYELNNKNYQNIFDRQLQNMEVARGIQSQEDLWREFAGLFGGMGLGATAGGNLGGAFGPWGAAAGAAIGGTIGGAWGMAGGIIDKNNNEIMYQENRQFAIDNFRFQLGNIKALPQSLTKVCALSYNYKFFPVVEKYRCTYEEEQALLNKIKYNGMSVGVIGKISEYLDNSDDYCFIKGQIINIDGIDNSSSISMAIFDEISKGVFFKVE